MAGNLRLRPIPHEESNAVHERHLQGTDTSKLERLLAKTITFFVIFLVSMVATVICDTHHYLIIRKWQPVTTECKAFYGGERCIRPPLPQVDILPLPQTADNFRWSCISSV